MRLIAARLIALALLVLCAAGPVAAASSAPHASAAVQARLITAEDGVRADAGTVSAGLDVTLADGWKTYWRSPGEVGLPPEIDWSGSENVADVTMLWPAPERFRAFGIENFGYDDQVVLPLQVRLEEPGAPVKLRGVVFLLVCAELCVPEQFQVALDLPRGGGIDPVAAERIAAHAARVPETGASAGVATLAAALDADALTVELASATPFDAPDIFPERDGAAFGPPDIRLGEGGRTLWARLPVLAPGEGPLQVTVTDGARAATLDAPLGAAAPAPPFRLDRATTTVAELVGIALVAVLGGLVLNVMPCVLPVLSIKLSSAVSARGQSAARVRRGFLVSALGVLGFIWLLAAGTLAARGLGLSVGWGLQFQNPVFLAAMIAVLVVFAANLAGLFEINLPSAWQTRLANSEGGPGYAGDFATGAFAAILATPCSAPFLGTAVAFALAGRPLDIVVIFTALGAGLALPYLAVAARPGLVRVLPRPGRWMLALKLALGVLLAGTALWLAWVLAGVAGLRASLAVVVLVALLVAVLWQGRRLPRLLAAGAAATLLAGAVAAPLAVPAPAPQVAAGTGWQAFDRAQIAREVSEGRTVFVDVTADWCLTCKANKALVLNRDDVAAALAAPDVTPMRADWTRPDPAISRYLETHGRFGIPFNAVYGPAAPEGIVLPELLSRAAVLDALAAAGLD